MKKIILSIVAVATLAALPMGVKAQISSNITGVNSYATVVKAITISKDGYDLNFGTFTPGTGGSVTLIPGADGKVTRTASSNVALLASAQNAIVSIPTFTVGGEGSYTYAIQVQSIIPLANQNGTGSMSVTIAANKLGADITTGKLSGSFAEVTAGADAFMLDAVLSVGPAQASGKYAGTFNVNVAYN